MVRLPHFLDPGEEQNQKCLQAIFVTDPLDDMQMIESKKDRLVDHTGWWILQSPSFRTWLDSDTSALLWLHGDPGKGKTMLAISLVRDIAKRIESEGPNSKRGLAYFFCDNEDERRKTATAILRGLLYQIFCQRPELCVYLRSEYEKQKDHLLNSPNALHTLWRIFQNIASYPNMEELYVIIDALDECDQESADSLLELLEPYSNYELNIAKKQRTQPMYPSCRMKVLLTSRNEIAIKERLCGSLEISLEQNSAHVDNAVHEYVDLRVKQLQSKTL